MSNEVDKVLARAGELKYLGKDRAFMALIFAMWTVRKQDSIWRALAKLALLAGGAGGYGYWTGLFS